jgi:hypothetical protein
MFGCDGGGAAKRDRAARWLAWRRLVRLIRYYSQFMAAETAVT